MERTVSRPASRLEALRPAVLRALPAGLPLGVEAFYARGDGLSLSYAVDGRRESAEIVGLERMFGGLDGAGGFAPYAPVGRGADLSERLGAGGPFEDVFYSSHDEDLTGPRSRARVDLLLRLKLVADVEGESAAFGIDYYSGEGGPKIYLVEDAREPHPLALDFETFVDEFSRFGTRRWYLAYLGRASERAMNVDFAAEMEASLAPFGATEVRALRERARAVTAAQRRVRAR